MEGIPELIENWTDLVEIYMYDNTQIEVLPSFIGSLTKLKRIEANNCSISNIPEEIGNLKGLMILNLNNNDLTSFSIPTTIQNLSSLVRLFLR